MLNWPFRRDDGTIVMLEIQVVAVHHVEHDLQVSDEMLEDAEQVRAYINQRTDARQFVADVIDDIDSLPTTE